MIKQRTCWIPVRGDELAHAYIAFQAEKPQSKIDNGFEWQRFELSTSPAAGMREALEQIERNSRLDGGNPSQDGDIARKALSTAPDQTAGGAVLDRETIQIILDLLNPLHGSIDEQTYDDKLKGNFDLPGDAEHNVNITSKHDRDLTQAVSILENRLRATPPGLDPVTLEAAAKAAENYPLTLMDLPEREQATPTAQSVAAAIRALASGELA